MLCAATGYSRHPTRHASHCGFPVQTQVIFGCQMHAFKFVMHRATTISHPWKKPNVEDDANRNATSLFLLLRLGTLDLCRSSEGLLPVLALLACKRGNLMSAMHSL